MCSLCFFTGDRARPLDQFTSRPACQKSFVDAKEAQKSRVVRVKKLLSDDEIQELLECSASLRNSCGVNKRDKHGFVQMDGPWDTTYLHTDDQFGQAMPHLKKKILDAVQAADKAEWGLLEGKEHVTVRVIEHHKVSKGGGLLQKDHIDYGSLLTLDVMLSDPGDFEGGVFHTVEADGTVQPHEFAKGDMMLFQSHKYHAVSEVKAGLRQVLIMELWQGEERRCAHRCEQHWGDCPCTLLSSRLSFIGSASIDQDIY